MRQKWNVVSFLSCLMQMNCNWLAAYLTVRASRELWMGLKRVLHACRQWIGHSAP